MAALGPLAAGSAWLAVLVSLNVTGDPAVSGTAFVALSILALRTGHRRLLVLSLVVGAGMLLLVPGVAIVDGSWAVTFREWRPPATPAEWLLAAGSALRVPAQVLAATFLAIVPARLLLAGAARLSPDTALLGALAARLGPLLARDARLVRDELASRGLRVGRTAPLVERARAVGAMWEAVVSGLLDRSFVTAASLHARGYGIAPSTTGPLRHPDLADGRERDRRVDRFVVLLAAAFVAVVLLSRSAGELDAPALGALGGAAAVPGAAALLAAVLAASLALAPLLAAGAATVDRAPAVQPASGATTPARLELCEVSMTYPGSAAPSLRSVSLVVEPGELVVVTGASGGGKSTLLDVVSGVAPRATGGCRAGEVRLGRAVLDHLHDGCRGRVAAVFQDPESQVLVGRVAEEVAFGLRHGGVQAGELDARVLDALDRLDVRHLARRDCSTLSGGELQRVLLAAALALQPAVLVLDEPTSQVDAASEARFWDAVDCARRDRSIGVLVAEHRLAHVATRADRVVQVEAGRIVADLPARDAADRLPLLATDAFAQLAPAPLPADSPTRLAVRVDRLDVGADGARRTLLRGLAFAAPAGATITLEGPNGTGKSSLLRAIRGLHGGAVVAIDGRLRGEVGASVRQVAFLSQGAGALLPGRSLRHAIEETCLRLGIDTGHARAALSAAGLGERLDAHPSELSVGERQRLALVASTAHRPPVWLLDEPTRGMDAASRRWVALHVLAHAQAGGVTLLATHDPELAAAVASHRLRLDLRTGPSLLPVERGAGGRIVAPARSDLGGSASSPRADRQEATR